MILDDLTSICNKAYDLISFPGDILFGKLQTMILRPGQLPHERTVIKVSTPVNGFGV